MPDDNELLLPASRIELAAGRQLRVARLGAGPTLVLFHGYPENLQIWCRLAPLLAEHFEVIALDWPGQGYSDVWPGGATPLHLARRIRSILDQLAIDRPVVVGIDMGGQPALAFAAMFPDRIRRLAVMNSLVFGDEPTSWEIHLLRKFRFNRWALQWLPGMVFRRAVNTFLPAGVSLPDAVRADFWTAFRRWEVRQFISKMCAGYQGTLPRLPALYERIQCSTQVIWAERDKHFPVNHAQRLQATVPGARLQILPGATHWMPLTHARPLAELLSQE